MLAGKTQYAKCEPDWEVNESVLKSLWLFNILGIEKKNEIIKKIEIILIIFKALNLFL